jgi:GNAT superfamily N-acetyltransferase
MEYELKRVEVDDPAVEPLVTSLRDEIDTRGAHADESADEFRKPVAEAVRGDAEILVAYAGEVAIGIVALRNLGPGIGEVKRMYVVPAHRGAGAGRLLLQELERRARRRGLETLRLDTHDRLGEAEGLYRSMGYREVPDYNGNPTANRWFEKSLA